MKSQKTKSINTFEEEIVKLLVLQIKRDFPHQSDLIVQLNSVGFGNSRIAQLLGTTPNTVNVALQRIKIRKPKKK